VLPRQKIQNSLPFDLFNQKLANSDVTKEALNYTASLYQLTALLMPLVSSGILFCDLKNELSSNLALAPVRF